jgi:hypothetical protein
VQPYLAHCLVTLREQVNADEPRRSKTDDGWIGDSAHRKRHSDHNPDARSCVCAIDLTHDPKRLDSYRFAEMLRRLKDSRTAYVISNHKIFYGDGHLTPWVWQAYAGADPHTGHVHISCRHEKHYADDPTIWNYRAPPAIERAAQTEPPAT